MNRLSTVCAVLLAVPLLGSGFNTFVEVVAPPAGDSAGEELLRTMRAGGLWHCIAIGHLVVGGLLLAPRTRFAAGLIQLPLSVGIVAFNVLLFPPGVPLAIAMLALNAGVLADRRKMQAVLQAPSPPDASEPAARA